MKKILFNFVILTTLVVLLLFSLTSCTTVTPPVTGIVTITLEIFGIDLMVGADLERPLKNYYIYMDDVYQGTMTSSGVLTLEDVPLGIHTFEASDHLQAGISFSRNIDIDLQEDLKDKANGMVCNGSVIFKVKLGVNYVTIPVNCNLSIIM